MTDETSPRGVRQPNGQLKVAVSFPEALFYEIKAMSIAEGKTFSAMTAELCRLGLFDLEESDRLEPEPRGQPGVQP